MRDRDNSAKTAKTKATKERRLMRRLKEMERKRLKDNVKAYHYEIKENLILKIKDVV